MNQELRQLASNAYLTAVDAPPGAAVVLPAFELLQLTLALFAQDRQLSGGYHPAALEREAARAKRAAEFVKRAGSRHAAAGSEATSNPPPGHPGRQLNLVFNQAAFPPPSSFGLPATRGGR